MSTTSLLRRFSQRTAAVAAAVALAGLGGFATTVTAAADDTPSQEAIDAAAEQLEEEGVPEETANSLRLPFQVDLGAGPRMIPIPNFGTIGWDKTDQAGFAVLTDPGAKSITIFMHYPNGVPTTVRDGKEVACGSAMDVGWVNLGTGESGLLPLTQWTNTELQHRGRTIKTGLGPIALVIYGSDPYGVGCPAPGDGVLTYIPTPAILTNL